MKLIIQKGNYYSRWCNECGRNTKKRGNRRLQYAIKYEEMWWISVIIGRVGNPTVRKLLKTSSSKSLKLAKGAALQ